MTEKAKTPPPNGSISPGRNSLRSGSALTAVLVGIALALLTAAVYLPVARNDFVNYDDADYVTGNPYVQGGVTWEDFKWAFTTRHASNWHPLTWLSHALDCQLFGPKAKGPHVVNLLLHVANTVLLFAVLRQLTGALWRSAVVAALFGLHPLHVESVAWISERKDVLSTFFFLLALWAYAKYGATFIPKAAPAAGDAEAKSPKRKPLKNAKDETVKATSLALPSAGETPAPPRSVFYALTLTFFVLGLLSKPMLVTLPFVLLLLDYWPLKRISWDDRRTWARVVLEKLPFFVMVAASCVVTFIVQKKGGAVSTSVSLGLRIANALVAYARYIRKLFWPDDLSVLYPHPGHWPASEVAFSAALLVAITAAVFVFGRQRRYLIVGWLWYIGTLVPVIGLIQVGIQSMADRYMYVPATGLFIILVWGVGELLGYPANQEEFSDPGVFSWRPWPEGVLAMGVAGLLAVCGWLTVRQIGYWRNSDALFRHAVEVTRNNYLAYNNLGFYLQNEGKTAEAMDYYRSSLSIKPDYVDALNNLGYGYAGLKKHPEAIRWYEAALRIEPRHAEVNNNIGNALSEIGKVDEAIAHYKVTLEQKPEYSDAHNNLGIALAMKGKLDEAIPEFHLAIHYKPGNAGAHSNLGNALAAQHKLDEAIREYQETLRLQPDDARAHNNLGNALAEQGKIPEAIKQYREALRLMADNPEAECNLALALVRVNQRDEAIIHFKEALRLRPDYSQVRQQLEALGVSPGK